MGENRTGGEISFFQDDVVVFIVGPLKEEIAFLGKILIIEESHGPVVDWIPCQQLPSSPKPSPDSENVEWGDFTVVGYKAKASEDDSVDIKAGSKCPKEISFDVADVTSFRKKRGQNSTDNNKVIVSFSLKDGTSIPAFHFKNCEAFKNFLRAFENYVNIKMSQKDSTLYLVNDPDSLALAKSFSELELFDNEKPRSITNFFRDSPYLLMGKFSKVANYWLFQNEAGSPIGYGDEKMAEILSQSLGCIQIDQEESGYELITCFEIPPRVPVSREEPVTLDEWQSFVDFEGRMPNANIIKTRIFKGGLMNSLRSEAWKYLVGYYEFEVTYREREMKKKQKADDYYRMKLQWKTISPDQESRFSGLRERRNIIEKDVSRTDRAHPFFEGENNVNIQMLYDILMTYCMYNFDLGYVQGMSDLLSPILVVMQKEADAFWCFAHWMEKMGVNFEMEQLGIKTQLQNLSRLLHFVDCQFSSYLESHESGNLYFAFRWLLILFKRDFKFEEVMRIWEVLWTDLPCKNFHLLICIAILDTEKTTIMENNYGLTEILKHINDLAYKLNLEETLAKAEAIYNQICSCNQVPDVVQNILGLELEDKITSIPEVRKEPTRVPLSSQMVHIEDTINDKVNDTTPNTSSCEDYVNIDEQLYSFGLFT